MSGEVIVRAADARDSACVTERVRQLAAENCRVLAGDPTAPGAMERVDALFPPEPADRTLAITCDPARLFPTCVLKPGNPQPFYAKFRKRESKKSRHR